MKDKWPANAERGFAILLSLSFVFSGCSQRGADESKSLTPKSDMPIVLSSSTDFGYIVSGSDSVVRLAQLRNLTGGAVEVSRWTASCGCLTIEPARITVGSLESTYIRLIFDPTKESDRFVGSLLMNVEGFDDAKCVCKFEVAISVIVAEDVQHLGLQKTEMLIMCRHRFLMNI